MINQTDNFKLGQQLFHKGLRYTQLNKELGGKVHKEVYQGFDHENRVTRNGFLLADWNQCGNYKTSSDLRTLF